MKKGLKLTVASVMAMSAVTPVAVLANEAPAGPAAAGFYTADGYYSPVQFKNLTKEEKQALLARADLVLVLDEKVYFGKDSIGKSDAELATLAIPVAQFEAENGKLTEGGYGEAPVAELKVESVSAINANAVKVTFNKAVEDTTKASFAVKRGTVTEDVTVTWNEAKTEATLTKSGNFTPAEYTVTVSGLEGLTNAEGKVTFAAEEVKEVKIVNTVLQQSNPAQLNVEFINQYGQKATVAANSSDLTVTAFNKTKGAALSTVTDKLKLNANSAVAAINDEVVVTILYKGVSTTATLKVVAPAGLSELTLGDIVLPTGQDKITPALTKNVELKYTAKNSLGEEYKLTSGDLVPGTLVLSSDNTILDPSAVTVTDGKVTISEFKKAGTVTLTVVVPASGTTTTKTITVAADAGKPESVELEKAEASFAAGSTTGINVGYTVKDNYGTTIAADKVVTSDYAISSDNEDVATAAFGTATNAGKLVITPKSGVTKGQSATISVLVKSTGQKATIKVTAADAAVPTIIEQKGTTAVPTSLVVGGQTDIGFEIKDQYGAVLSSLGTGYTVDYVSSDKTVIDFTSDANTDKTTITTLKLRAEAKKAGSATIKAQLKKDGVVVSEKAYSIQVLANTSAGSTYSVTPVEPIYKGKLTKDLAGETLNSTDAATSAEKMVNSGYAEKLELKVTQGSATSVVPISALAAAPTVEIKKADGSDTTGKLSVTSYNGSYYVYTSTAFDPADFATANGGTADLKGKVTFTVNAEDGLKIVTQEITVSKDELKAQSVEFKSAAPGTANAIKVTSKSVDTVALLGSAGITDTYLWVKDQFGGYSIADSQAEVKAILNLVKGTNSDVVTPTITVATSSDVAAAQTGVIKATATPLTATANNATVRLYAQIGELTDSVNITIGKENVAPTITSVTSATLDKAAKTLVLTVVGAGEVGDLVDVTKITVKDADASLSKALTTSTGVVTNATTITITLSDADLAAITTAAGNDVTIDVADGVLKDAAGNVSANFGTPQTGIAVTVTP